MTTSVKPARTYEPPSARSHFVRNVGSNVGFMAASALLMVWYVPYLIDHLGVAAYGVVPLANSLVLYGSLATEGLSVALNRFLTIDLHRGDDAAATQTFNTAFFTALGILVALLPVAILVTWLFPTAFTVPAGMELGARLVFAGVVVAFLTTFLAGTFEVSAFATHRFDLRNVVRAVSLFTRVGLVVLFFALFGAHLWLVGIALAAGGLAAVSGNWLLWRRLTPQLRISARSFDRTRLNQLFSLGGWSILNRIGMLLFLASDIVIVNKFLGPAAAGRYGALIFFPELLRGLVDTVSSVLNPAIVSRYALGDFEGVRSLAARSVKVMGIALAVPIGLMCGLSSPFLTVWLGPEFRTLALVLVVLVGHLSVNLATLPLAYVLTAYNRMRFQGLATLGLGLINVALAVFFVAGLGWGAVGVAAATAIVLTVKNLLVLSAYTSHLLGRPWWSFYGTLALNLLATALVAGGCLALGVLWPAHSWSGLAGTAAVVTAGYAVLAWNFALNREDRRLLIGLVPSNLRRRGRPTSGLPSYRRSTG